MELKTPRLETRAIPTEILLPEYDKWDQLEIETKNIHACKRTDLIIWVDYAVLRRNTLTIEPWEMCEKATMI